MILNELRLLLMAIIVICSIFMTFKEIICQKIEKLDKSVDDSSKEFFDETYSPQLHVDYDNIPEQNDYSSYESVEQEHRDRRSIKSDSKTKSSHWKSHWRSNRVVDATEFDQRCGVDYLKVCCDADDTDATCECRCGVEKTDTGGGAPYGCPLDDGQFTDENRPTLVAKSTGEGGGAEGGSETSKGTRVKRGPILTFLSIICPTTYLIIAITMSLLYFYVAF